jgi:cyclic pyranopterin phosphate synthase
MNERAPTAPTRDLLPVADTRGRPLADLRLSVMDRCNFRCPYCMPRDTYGDGYRFLSSRERLSFDELVRVARLFVRLGVRKIRLTGGEPLLRPNLADLVGDLAGIDGLDDLALTTNGVLLGQHAAVLAANGLQRVTVSLDTLDREVFRHLSGGFDGLDEVLAGIRAALAVGLAPLKVNAVVQRGVNDHTVLDMVEHFRGSGVTPRFIEYMDVGNRNAWEPARVVPSRELVDRIDARWPLEPVHAGYRGEVAARYRFTDGAGEVGFVSSVSQPFCGDCTRARLSSEGVLYTCLFATAGVDLRAPLRAGHDDDAMLALLAAAWRRRADRYSEVREQLRREQPLRKIEMHYIGG